ncbi:unnamed protein product, partial [Candidula unifasciata]
DPSLNDVVDLIKNKLEHGLKFGNKQAQKRAIDHLQKTRNELKVKCEFGGEKRVLSVPRPVQFADLCRRLQDMYQMMLNIFYTQSNGE